MGENKRYTKANGNIVELIVRPHNADLPYLVKDGGKFVLECDWYGDANREYNARALVI